MAYGYNYGGYPNGGYYAPPMPDQLAQLRNNQYNPNMMQPQNMQMPNNMTNTMPNMQINQPAMNTAPSNGILWVSNEREASEYPLAINSAVALWDSNSPVIYLKQSDASGKPSMKIYDLVERDTSAQVAVKTSVTQNVDYVTRREFEALQARFDALMMASAKEPSTGSRSRKNAQKSEDEAE